MLFLYKVPPQGGKGRNHGMWGRTCWGPNLSISCVCWKLFQLLRMSEEGLCTPWRLKATNDNSVLPFQVFSLRFSSFDLFSVPVGVSAGIGGNVYFAALLVTQSGFVYKG